MRRPIPRSAGRQKLTPRTVSAPIEGWNARDAIAAMRPTFATQLDNFLPTQRGVSMRRGSTNFATFNADVRVRSFLPYEKSDGTWKLFAANDSGIFDVTAGGSINNASPASAASNGDWVSVNFSNTAGNFLWACNGVDNSRVYNGTSWQVLSAVSAPINLTGIVSSEITNVSVFKERLYLCEKDSLSFWYLPVSSLGGAASEFPLGPVFAKGGYLVATGSWTLDGGEGPEDYFVAITSQGEVAVYAGTDPSNAATWALQGVYFIPEPLNKRCFTKWGGDMLVLTTQGLIPLSRALQSPVVDTSTSISDNISQAWIQAADTKGDLFGWQTVIFPKGPFLLVNVPQVYSASAPRLQYSYQYVMNTQTKAWCRFTGWPSETWVYVGKRLFYARFSEIFEAWVGNSDEDNFPVDARCRTAFMYPSNQLQNKVNQLRPIISSEGGGFEISLGIDRDFRETSFIQGSSIVNPPTTSIWDNAKWDQGVWSDSTIPLNWRSVSHYPGNALALRLRIVSDNAKIEWTATNFLLEKGKLL